PRTAKAIEALRDAIGSPRYESVLAEVWEETDRTTVDYGIAGKAENGAVVPADIGWPDLAPTALLADVVSAADNWASRDWVAEGAAASATRLGAPGAREPAEASEAGGTPARGEGFGGAGGDSAIPKHVGPACGGRRRLSACCLVDADVRVVE